MVCKDHDLPIWLVEAANDPYYHQEETMKYFESGYWAIPESTARNLVGKFIHLHEKQAAASYFGGEILSYRVVEDGEWAGRIIFRFKPTKEQKGVQTTATSWGAMKEKLITPDGVHLLDKKDNPIGLLQPA